MRGFRGLRMGQGGREGVWVRWVERVCGYRGFRGLRVGREGAWV